MFILVVLNFSNFNKFLDLQTVYTHILLFVEKLPDNYDFKRQLLCNFPEIIRHFMDISLYHNN